MDLGLQFGATALLGALVLAGCSAAASPGPGAATSRTPGLAARASAASESGSVLHALRAKLTCPARQPQPEPSPPGTRAARLALRPAPVIAVFCQYNARHVPAIPAPVPRVVLTGAAAAGMSAIIDGLAPVPFPDLGCPRMSPRYSQTIFFGYSSGPAVTATVTYCPAEIRISGQSLQVSGPVADDLSAYAAGVWHNSGPRTPDLIGMSLPRAEAAARQAGMTVSLSGAEPDAGAAFGSVIFQALPAGYPSRLHNGPQVGIVVATRPAPACTRSQLRLAYRADGARSGSDFGAVVIADAGPAPCTLSGLIQVAGLSRAGRTVTTTFRSRLPAHAARRPGSRGHRRAFRDPAAAGRARRRHLARADIPRQARQPSRRPMPASVGHARHLARRPAGRPGLQRAQRRSGRPGPHRPVRRARDLRGPPGRRDAHLLRPAAELARRQSAHRPLLADQRGRALATVLSRCGGGR